MQTATKHFTIKGGAEYLGLSTNQIYDAIYGDRLKATKQGQKWDLTKEDLDTFWDIHVMPSNSKTSAKSAESQALTETTEEITVQQETTEESQAVEEVPLTTNEVEETTAEVGAEPVESRAIKDDPVEVEVEPEEVRAVEDDPADADAEPEEVRAALELPVESDEIEEWPSGVPLTPIDKLEEAMRDIANAKGRLKRLGVPLEHIDEIVAAVAHYEKVRETIDFAREQQFFVDALALLDAFKEGGNEASRVALFLRHFAEHVVAQTMDLAPHFTQVTAIVDRIDPMESEE